MDQVGPMSRTVEDCAITLQAIAGHDPKDPYTWDVPVPDYRRSLDGDIRGLKVGAVTERVHSDRVDPEYRDVVGKAIASLGELGATVEEVSIPLTEMSGAVSMGIATAEWAAVHDRTFRAHFKELDHNNRIRYPTGRVLPAQAYYKAQKIRALLRRQMLDALERFDVVGAAYRGRPPRRPWSRSPACRARSRRWRGLGTRASFTGPGPTWPVRRPCPYRAGSRPRTYPWACRSSGRPFDEATVMKVAYAYEQSTGWHKRRPPV